MPKVGAYMSVLDDLLSELNPEQKKAATFGGRRLMVLAGAGSGKTKTLVSRLAYFCQMGALPESLMAITFTNKAAREMKERLEQCVPGAKSAYVGTFHKISHLMLRRYGQYISLDTSFQIITPSDQKRIIKEGIKQLKISLDNNTSESFILRSLSNRHQLTQEQFWQRESHPVGRLLKYYDEVCLKENLIDFDGLILKATELFKTPFVKENFCQKLHHICIDEFQDTNYQQILWLEAILGSDTGLTLVGDDDQSIYRFRGSDVTLMQTAHNRFDGLELMKLEQNYRSTSTIVNAANDVIAKNSIRLGKNLWTQNVTNDKITIFEAYNEFAEVDSIAQKIHQLLHEKVPLSAIAVLYRSNMQSRLFESVARKYQWPYNLSGGLSFYDREEVKDILCYLQLLIDTNSWLALSRVINKPSRKIGAKTLEKIRDVAIEYDLMPWDALVASQSLFKGKVLESISSFISLIEEHRQLLAHSDLADVASSLIAKSDIITAYADNKEQRSDNLYELINAMIDFQEKEGAQKTTFQMLTDFLSDVSLSGSAPVESGQQVEALTLSTVHAAKGLEWPYVFIVGLEEELFPHQRAHSDEEQDEERRLFYVALTRAKSQCFLSYALYRKKGYENHRGRPSRFIKDISSKYIKLERASYKPQSQQPRTYF